MCVRQTLLISGPRRSNNRSCHRFVPWAGLHSGEKLKWVGETLRLARPWVGLAAR